MIFDYKKLNFCDTMQRFGLKILNLEPNLPQNNNKNDIKIGYKNSQIFAFDATKICQILHWMQKNSY